MKKRQSAAAKGSPMKAAKKSVRPKNKASDQALLLANIKSKAKQASVKLNKGATDKAIAKLEATLGFPLPDEVRAFYKAHDGSRADAAIEGRELLSVERIIDEWKVWKELLDGGDLEANDHGKPGRGVQKKWWIPQWVPVTHDGAGNHHLIDLAPAKNGTHGQVLSFWHDEPSRTVVGQGFLRWLAHTATWGDPDTGDDENGGDDDLDDDFFRRFEKGKDFWAICFDGLAVIVRSGKRGTKGQQQTKKFTSAKDALKEHNKLIKDKTGEGYKEVS